MLIAWIIFYKRAALTLLVMAVFVSCSQPAKKDELTHGDGISKRMLIYKSVDDTSSRFMLIQEAFLIIDDKILKGQLNVFAQSQVEYFLQGTKVDDQYVGEYIMLNRENKHLKKKHSV